MEEEKNGIVAKTETDDAAGTELEEFLISGAEEADSTEPRLG